MQEHQEETIDATDDLTDGGPRIQILIDSDIPAQGEPSIQQEKTVGPLSVKKQAQGAKTVQKDQTSDDNSRHRLHRRPSTIQKSDKNRFVRDDSTVVPVIGGVNRQQTSDYSRAYITRRFSIRSNRAQVMFEHAYDRVDYSLQILTSVISDIASEDYANQVQKEVDELFSAFEDNIKKGLESLRQVLIKRGVSEKDFRSGYDHPRTYDTPVRSPYSLRYLDLVQRYDDINAYTDCLWLHGFLDTRMRSQTADLWEKTFRRFASDLAQLRLRALREAGEESNKRYRAAIQQGQKDTQQEAKRILDEQTSSNQSTNQAK